MGIDTTLVCPWDPHAMDPRIRARTFPRAAGAVGRLANMRDIAAILTREDADIYHFHDIDIAPMMALFHLRTGRPVVYDIHENYSLEMYQKTYLQDWMRPVLASAVYWTQRYCTAIVRNVVAVVDRIEKDFARPGVRCMQVRNFASRDVCRVDAPPYRRRPPVVSFLASQYVWNGSRVFLDAAERVLQRHPEARFESIDRFSHEEALRREAMDRCSRPPLAGAVEYLPLVPVHEVPHYVKRARVGLYLGLDVPKQREALPTKLFEYMGCGVPVVASDLPYARRHVGETGAGLLSRPGDAADVAEKVCHLLEHPQQAEAMGRRGRQAISDRLNWEAEMERLVRFYETILPESGVRASIAYGA
jgi:glycosyltransferase involved in cell wall biosynthesis